MEKLKRVIQIILIIILLLASNFIGFFIGSKSVALNPINGTYNVDVYRNGKAVITTKIQNIESDSENNRLIIHGVSTHKPIE